MKQFVVIGIGRFGSSVASTLYRMGHEVLAIDSDEEKVHEIQTFVTHAVQADATDEKALKALGLRNFDVVVVSIGQDIQASILVTLIVKELGVNYVVTKAQNDLHGKVLYKIGADKVVFPERDMGARLAHNLVSSNVLDYIELSSNYSIIELSAPQKFIGKSLRQLNLRVRFGLNVMAIRRYGKIDVSPDAEQPILEDDVLIVIGENEKLAKIEEHD